MITKLTLVTPDTFVSTTVGWGLGTTLFDTCAVVFKTNGFLDM